MRRVLPITVLVCAAVACSRASSTVGSPSASETATDAHLEALVGALDTVQGEFRDLADLTFAFISETRILEAIAAYNQRAVPRLVECLGDTKLARATAEHVGRIRVGVLCYEALVYTDYFQARNSAQRWPEGFIDSTFFNFNADPAELRRAQRAWRAYLRHEAANQ
jgi:hypothetical protein